MTDTHNPHDELVDQLVDQALGEVVGGRRPPDLSGRILQAAGKSRLPQRSRRARYALAACLLIAASAGLVTYSTISSQQALTAQADRNRNLGQIGIAVNEHVRDSLDAFPMQREPRTPAPEQKTDESLNRSANLAVLSDEEARTRRPGPIAQDGTFVTELKASGGVFRFSLGNEPGMSGGGMGPPPADQADQGRGPGQAGDRYSRIVENPFLLATENPLSTFSIDVDTASYAKVRRYIMENNSLPPPDAVRIEEMVNYFPYDYPPPEGEHPFAAHVEVAACPWQPEHRLVRIGLKGKEIPNDQRPASNLVFLLDVSGSMQPDDRLPRVRRAMRMLVEQLGENDRVAIVVYASATGLVLPSTPGYQQAEILAALDNLQAGGSTNGGHGIRLAYDTARAHYIKGGTNRVILCTDGDFNVGVTSPAELERMAEQEARSGVFLSVMGFGMGNHNDAMLEKLADKGNGNYAYIDSEQEARKVLVEQMGGTLITIAKDVKIQIEFNPRQVGTYRLIGYENRLLRAEDFNDDKKDAGEIGAGHTVTALYQVAPPDSAGASNVDPLKYQKRPQPADDAGSDELLTLKLKYKKPDADASEAALVHPVTDQGMQFGQASDDFKFAAAVAAFGMLLRDSAFKGGITYDAVLEIAQDGLGPDAHAHRSGFIELVTKAKSAQANQGF